MRKKDFWRKCQFEKSKGSRNQQTLSKLCNGLQTISSEPNNKMPAFQGEGKKEMNDFKSDFDKRYKTLPTSRRSPSTAYLCEKFNNNFGVAER